MLHSPPIAPNSVSAAPAPTSGTRQATIPPRAAWIVARPLSAWHRRLRRFLPVLLLLLGGTAAECGASGLLLPDDTSLPPLRIEDHLVEAEIRDGVARTTVRQVFRNDSRQRLEATYLFPLPEDADVVDFAMSFNGKMVTGEVLPTEEAARQYEEIVRRTMDPGIIEFVGRRLLRMRVFPIEPGSATTIRVGYQQVCGRVGDMNAFRHALRTSRTDGRAHGTVRFDVKVATTAPLRTVWSPSHAAEVVRGEDEHSARVAYEVQGSGLEEDFVLLYDTDGSDLGLSLLAAHATDESDVHGHFVLLLSPRLLWPDEDRPAQDVVFVVDTSGSMAGEKLDQAKEALRACIGQLDARDRFSVVRFSTGFDQLWDAPLPATRERRAEAIAWTKRFRPAGGTNISDALGAVADMRRAQAERDAVARPFVVIFLTDGRGNRETEEILAALADSCGDESPLRVFPFGIGEDVNTTLLDGLATSFRGRPTYVRPGEDLELVLGDFFSVVAQPVLTDLRLSLPDVGATERFPATLGDLYHGQQLILAGRFDRDAQGPVTLTARRGAERVSYTWPDVSFAHDPGAGAVATIWAGRKISFLLDEVRRSGESAELLDEIVALGRRHGIQTPYSSWFVDPTGGVATNERIRLGLRSGRDDLGRPVPAPGAAPPGGSGGFAVAPATRLRGIFGDEFPAEGSENRQPDSATIYHVTAGESIDLALAERGVTAKSGTVAVALARRNAALREAGSSEIARLGAASPTTIRLGDRLYDRVGAWLVDESVREGTNLVVLRFASPAWFDLVRARPDLRPALAHQSRVVIQVAEDLAIAVATDDGIETIDAETMQQVRGSMR